VRIDELAHEARELDPECSDSEPELQFSGELPTLGRTLPTAQAFDDWVPDWGYEGPCTAVAKDAGNGDGRLSVCECGEGRGCVWR